MLRLIETIPVKGAFWRQYRHPSLGVVGTEVRPGQDGAADVITLVRDNIDFARAACAGEMGSEPFPPSPDHSNNRTERNFAEPA